MKRISLLICLLVCVACFLPSCKTDDGIMYDFPSLRIGRYCEIEDSAWQNLSLALDIASYTVTDEVVMEYMHEQQTKYLTGCPAEEKRVDRAIQKETRSTCTTAATPKTALPSKAAATSTQKFPRCLKSAAKPSCPALKSS